MLFSVSYMYLFYYPYFIFNAKINIQYTYIVGKYKIYLYEL